jgi:hypothetical protein
MQAATSRSVPALATVLLAITLAFPAAGAEILTPERAVDLALENHPVLRAADSEVAAAEADRALAKTGHLPRVDLVEDVARGTNPVFVFASKLGQERFGMEDFALDVLNSPDPFTNAATRISVRQNVWDAGRTVLYRKAAERGVEAAGRRGRGPATRSLSVPSARSGTRCSRRRCSGSPSRERRRRRPP